MGNAVQWEVWCESQHDGEATYFGSRTEGHGLPDQPRTRFVTTDYSNVLFRSIQYVLYGLISVASPPPPKKTFYPRIIFFFLKENANISINLAHILL